MKQSRHVDAPRYWSLLRPRRGPRARTSKVRRGQNSIRLGTYDLNLYTGTGSIVLAIARRVSLGRILLLADYNREAARTVAKQLQGEAYDAGQNHRRLQTRGQSLPLPTPTQNSAP